MKKKSIIIFALPIVIFCSTASTAETDPTTYNNHPFSTSTGDKWAVLVGIADYYGTENDLAFSHKDALDMKNTLINHGWDSDHILVLLNSSATKPNIQNAIENWLGSNVSAEDTVLFFYSGHGTYYSESQYNPDGDNEIDGKDEYLCSYSESFQIEYFIADGELDQYLDTLESEHITIIIDTCFSGGMTKAIVLQADEKIININKTPMMSNCEFMDRATSKTIKNPEVFIIDGLSKDIGGDDRIILMSCDDGESSIELPGFRNGIFTHYIVEGLQCMADVDSSGNITAEEVFAYAEPLIVSISEELGHVQHPQIYDSYTGDLHITGDLFSVLITVDDSGGADYTSIQEAVDAAQSCDTVHVYSGMYNESVLINKPVTLQGEGVDVVTINGDGNPGIILIAHHATVTGFTIEGAGKYAGIEVGYSHLCTISNNNVSRNGCGVFLFHSSDNVISDNTGNDNTDLDGVSLWYSCCNNLIMNNTVNTNRWSGVYLHSVCNNNTISNNIANWNRDPGILLYKSSNNKLDNNEIKYNTDNGLFLDNSDNNMLSNNEIKYNTINGIRLERSDENTINNCNISYNTDDGIDLYTDNDDNTMINNNFYSNKNGIILRYSSTNNLLYCNNFYNNTNENAHDECANHWNSITHGNYWDDYNGSDADLNGIGDTPYPIPSGSNIDYYPLMQPWITVNTSISISTGSAIIDVNDTIILPITIENAVDIQQVTLDLVYDQDVVSIINITANETVPSSTVTYTLYTGSATIELTNPDNITVTSSTPVIDITFQAGENTGVTALQLQNVEVVDNTGSHAPDTVVDGSLTVCIKGDFNNNNKVDIGDVARVAFMVAEKVPEYLRADFNNNGCVDVGDAAKISFYLAEKVSEL